MPKIIKNGVTYTKDTSTLAQELVDGSSTISQTSGHLEANTSGLASGLTDGSTTMSQASGKIELLSGFIRGDGTTGAKIDGVRKIYSGTSVPANTFGENGDIFLVKQ